MRDDRFRADLLRLLDTEAGINVFRQLRRDMNYNVKTNVVLSSTGEVNTMALVNNEAIRAFWLNLREHIPYEKLILIEYDPPKKNEEESCQKKETQEPVALEAQPEQEPEVQATPSRLKAKTRIRQRQLEPNQE